MTKPVVPQVPPPGPGIYRVSSYWGFYVEPLTPPRWGPPLLFGVYSPTGVLLARARTWKRATDYALTLR